MPNALEADVGALRERVTVQQATAGVDAAGDPTYGWRNVVTLWAAVRASGGGVATVDGRRTGVQTYDVTIRRQEGLSPAHRLEWRGRHLRIERIALMDDRRLVVLSCRDAGPLAGTVL